MISSIHQNIDGKSNGAKYLRMLAQHSRIQSFFLSQKTHHFDVELSFKVVDNFINVMLQTMNLVNSVSKPDKPIKICLFKEIFSFSLG